MAATGLARAAQEVPGGGDASVSIVAAGSFGSITAEWAMLAGRSAAGNPFFHPEFAIPAIRHFGRGNFAVAAVRSPSGVLIGLAPFMRTRLGRIAPAVRLWTHKYAPFGDPLVDADDIDGALAGLIEGLAPAKSGLSLILPNMTTQGSLAEAMRANAFRSGRPLVLLGEYRRAMLTRGAAAADLRAGLPRRKRKELGRQFRRLGEIGAITVTSDTAPDDVCARFEEFLALEQSGWKGHGGTALASSAVSATFSREVLFNLAQAGKARIEFAQGRWPPGCHGGLPDRGGGGLSLEDGL